MITNIVESVGKKIKNTLHFHPLKIYEVELGSKLKEI